MTDTTPNEHAKVVEYAGLEVVEILQRQKPNGEWWLCHPDDVAHYANNQNQPIRRLVTLSSALAEIDHLREYLKAERECTYDENDRFRKAEARATAAEAREAGLRAIIGAEYDHWIKEALKHKRPGGQRSDHAQTDLERAKVVKRIVDKALAINA
jgi:hypothetical protein